MQSKTAALWESYYVKKPLTFWEFVEKQTNLKQLFGCIEISLKTYGVEFDKNLTKTAEIYASGATGIGKGVYAYLIIAYRLYLAMLLKNPKEEIFKIAPAAELSCLFAGKHCDEKLTGFLGFLRGIQDKENPLFVFLEDTEDFKVAKDCIVIYKDETGRYFAYYKGNEIAFRTIKSNAEMLCTNPLIVDYDADGYETTTAMRMYEYIKHRLVARFGSAKDLFSCLLVEKSPNNLYNDLIDQHIWKIEHPESLDEAEYLVERFVPIYMKDVKTVNELSQLPKNTHFIDLLNGAVGKIEDFDAYVNKHPKNDTREFPASKQYTFTSSDGSDVFVKENDTELLDLAFEDPKRFINEILGEPIPNPYKTTIEVKDALEALQTVRKLIVDYQMQFTFDKEGAYLAIPELNTKLKI